MKYTLILIIAIFMLSACSKSHDEPEVESTFIGTWVDAQYIDTIITVSRSSKLIEDKDGFILEPDGTFIQRTNSGWCGTPPITYANYNGTWTSFPDNTLFIETEYWGGITSYKIEVLSVDKEKMEYRIIYDN